MDRPSPKPVPDFTALIKLAEQYMFQRAAPDYCEDDDMRTYLFEAVIDTVYGKDAWAWFQQLDEDREIAAAKARLDELIAKKGQ